MALGMALDMALGMALSMALGMALSMALGMALGWHTVWVADAVCPSQRRHRVHKDVREHSQIVHSSSSQLVAGQLAIELAHAPTPFT